MAKIKEIKAHKILDSRGEWTIQTKVTLEDGCEGFGEVPTGASVGAYEATPLPAGVAVKNVNEIVASKLLGMEVTEQEAVDRKLLELDGTENKSNLGANTLLSVSLGVCKAAAKSEFLPLYKYIALKGKFPYDFKLPTPLFNVLNGGRHSKNDLDFQEFMITPGTYIAYKKGLKMGVNIYRKLGETLESKNLSTEVGDEGGFAPRGLTTESACELLIEAAEACGYKPRREVFIALDVAANTLLLGDTYSFKGEAQTRSAEELTKFYEELVERFPIVFLEDPFSEGSWEDWIRITKSLGEKIDIIGDDLIATNLKRLEEALEQKAVTGLIVKPNQIGTLSETLKVIKIAKEENLVVAISHRSGEAGEDTFISDLAVGVGAQYLKAGAPCRGERVVKYNRLLEIAEEISLGVTPLKG